MKLSNRILRVMATTGLFMPICQLKNEQALNLKNSNPPFVFYFHSSVHS